MEATLWSSVERLAPLAPSFVSVTYGADGSTRERTHRVVTRIQHETTLTGAPHLTCVGAARGEILDIARAYWEEGVRHLVALRGDPPQGEGGYRAHADGFSYAAELVAALARVAPFDISVAAYPEVHPEAHSAAGGPGEPQAQDRRRGEPRHHAVLLRHRHVPALSRPLRGSRHCRAHRSWDSAHHAVSAGACASPSAAAPAFPPGCRSASRGSRTTRIRAGCIAANVAIEQVQAAQAPWCDANFTSIRSIAPSSPTRSATPWGCARRHARPALAPRAATA